MKIEIEVKFGIGEVVLIKNTFPGWGDGKLSCPPPFKAVISGYVIHKSKKYARVMYTLEPLDNNITYKQRASLEAFSHKRRWNAIDLEKVEE